MPYHTRKLRFPSLFALLIFGPFLTQCALAQPKPGSVSESSLCNRENALEMIKQQIALSRTVGESPRRILLLIRSADLLWSYQQGKARNVFTEAFELAVENEKEKVSNASRVLVRRLQTPDQRYIVISAIARKDSVWAKELTRKVLKSAIDDVPSTSDPFENLLTAAKLLDTAYGILPTDMNVALDLARASFNYPASFALTRFLYGLAEVDQRAADQLYAQVLAVYRDKPMREFLYLQAYPFGLIESVNTPVYSYHPVPSKFVINQSLQRRFVEVLLRRAEQVLEVPLDEADTYRSADVNLMPGTAHLLGALVLLELQVSDSLPDLSTSLRQAREKLLVSLSSDTQRLLLQPGREISAKPNQTFDEQVDLAQKSDDVNERDDLITIAVLSSESAQPNLPVVVQAIDKVSNSTLRTTLLEWVYFRRAANAVQQKKFEEAERLTARVEGQEQRAYLHSEIARGLLNRSESQTHGRELLDEAITEAKRSAPSRFAVRTLLTAATLYTKVDAGRSISLLSDAINCINRIESQDFTSDNQALEMKLERKQRGGQYGGEYSFRFAMPGPQPESAFREMAKIDFDTTLAQSNSLSDKFQRSLATLWMAELCLAQPQPQPKAKVKKILRPST